MELEKKLEILKNLDTKNLMERVHQYEDALEKALREQASFKNLNYEYLAGRDGHCLAVNNMLAELISKMPEMKGNKRLSAAEKEAWLQRQYTENKGLSAAMAKQKDVAFLTDTNEINIEIAKKRLESTRGVLALRTAQIRFLTEAG